MSKKTLISMYNARTLAELPLEIIVEILKCCTFSSQDYLAFRKISKTFNHIIRNNIYGIANMLDFQLRRRIEPFFFEEKSERAYTVSLPFVKKLTIYLNELNILGVSKLDFSHQFPNLQSLKIYGNIQITESHKFLEVFSSIKFKEPLLSSLTSLEIDFNVFTKIDLFTLSKIKNSLLDFAIFKNFKNLKELNLPFFAFRNIDISGFKLLEKLTININRIKVSAKNAKDVKKKANNFILIISSYYQNHLNKISWQMIELKLLSNLTISNTAFFNCKDFYYLGVHLIFNFPKQNIKTGRQFEIKSLNLILQDPNFDQYSNYDSEMKKKDQRNKPMQLPSIYFDSFKKNYEHSMERLRISLQQKNKEKGFYSSICRQVSENYKEINLKKQSYLLFRSKIISRTNFIDIKGLGNLKKLQSIYSFQSNILKKEMEFVTKLKSLNFESVPGSDFHEIKKWKNFVQFITIDRITNISKKDLLNLSIINNVKVNLFRCSDCLQFFSAKEKDLIECGELDNHIRCKNCAKCTICQKIFRNDGKNCRKCYKKFCFHHLNKVQSDYYCFDCGKCKKCKTKIKGNSLLFNHCKKCTGLYCSNDSIIIQGSIYCYDCSKCKRCSKKGITECIKCKDFLCKDCSNDNIIIQGSIYCSDCSKCKKCFKKGITKCIKCKEFLCKDCDKPDRCEYCCWCKKCSKDIKCEECPGYCCKNCYSKLHHSKDNSSSTICQLCTSSIGCSVCSHFDCSRNRFKQSEIGWCVGCNLSVHLSCCSKGKKLMCNRCQNTDSLLKQYSTFKL